MSWKKIANGWLNKNTKSNPQNNLPMFKGSLTVKDDILAGDEVDVALWRSVKYGKESFGIALNRKKEETTSSETDVKSESF